MVVWKSGPNGKSEPISRRNNSLLRNLNASELTFVSCHALSSGGWEGSKEEQYIKLQMLSVPVLNSPKVVGQRGFSSSFFRLFFVRWRVYRAAYSACAHPAVSFVMGAAHSGCDSRAHPCTMTLGGEVEQGRVNDAARVGQSTDLVTAPLFLACFSLSLLAPLAAQFYALFCCVRRLENVKILNFLNLMIF